MSVVNVLFDVECLDVVQRKQRVNVDAISLSPRDDFAVTIVSLVEGSLNLHIKIFRLDQAYTPVTAETHFTSVEALCTQLVNFIQIFFSVIYPPFLVGIAVCCDCFCAYSTRSLHARGSML